MKAFIHEVTPINSTHAAVVAHVTHAKGENIADNLPAMLGAATDRQFVSVSGSVTILDAGRTDTYVRAIMQQTRDVRPASDSVGMRSVSANMYMDEQEHLWTLRSQNGSDVLVRSSDMNNSEELMDMIASCSSVTNQGGLRSHNPSVYRKLQEYMVALSSSNGGDMVSFVEDGKTHVGFVAARIQDEGKTTFLTVDKDGESRSISSDQMIAMLDGDQLTEFPDLNVSLSSAVDIDRLLSYYSQVFRYSPEYYARVEDVIRNHAFV